MTPTRKQRQPNHVGVDRKPTTTTFQRHSRVLLFSPSREHTMGISICLVILALIVIAPVPAN